MKKSVHVPLKSNPYEIHVFNSQIKDKTHHLQVLKPHVQDRVCFVVTDNLVGNLYGRLVEDTLAQSGASRVETVTFPAGEESKSLKTLETLYTQAIRSGIDRYSVIVSLGGGVVGDTAGFMAATYMRGLDLIQFPSSLVAQVDSSVGGKTGIDLKQGKNLVGAFYQPKIVLVDISTLRTLPLREIRCGLAEVVKYGVILDAEFFHFLESESPHLLDLDLTIYENIVLRCCSLKAQVVGEDERDQGLRAILNYGHTFGHALEMLSGYKTFTHGEAIAIGMGMAADLAVLLNKNPEKVELVERQDRLFRTLGLPLRTKGYAPIKILETMQKDKKYVKGKSKLILPEKMGKVNIVSDVPNDLVLKAIGGRCDR